MNLFETIFASSRVVSLILVPLIRGFASLFFAIAISKDCKARKNGSSSLWGLLVFISPVVFGLIYLFYSRFIDRSLPESLSDIKRVRSAGRFTAAAVLFYIVSLIIAVISIATGALSFVGSVLTDTNKVEIYKGNSYYDMNGVKYDNYEDVILYDKKGNTYHIELSPDGWNYYTYFDRNGNEYDIELCFISEDGYLYYDKEKTLTESEDLYYYDKTFFDENGNKFKAIGTAAFFDENGRIVLRHNSGKGMINVYSFADSEKKEDNSDN